MFTDEQQATLRDLKRKGEVVMSHTQQDYGYYILRVKERDGSWWDGSLAPDGSLTVIEHV